MGREQWTGGIFCKEIGLLDKELVMVKAELENL